MSDQDVELIQAQVRLLKNGDLVQKGEGGDILVAHYDRTTGHLEFETKKYSVDLYNQVTARIGTVNKGTQPSGLIIRSIGVKGQTPTPDAAVPVKKPKVGPEGDATPTVVDWYIKYKPAEAVIRYGIYTDANGEFVRRRVQRVVEVTRDRRNVDQKKLPWVDTGPSTQDRTPVTRDGILVEVKRAIIARRATRYENDPDILDDLNVEKLEALFTPEEVVGGFTPEEADDVPLIPTEEADQ